MPLLVVGICIWLYSYYRNCITRTVLAEENTETKVKRYTTIDGKNDEKWSHVVVLGLFLAITSAIIFL